MWNDFHPSGGEVEWATCSVARLRGKQCTPGTAWRLGDQRRPFRARAARRRRRTAGLGRSGRRAVQAPPLRRRASCRPQPCWKGTRPASRSRSSVSKGDRAPREGVAGSVSGDAPFPSVQHPDVRSHTAGDPATRNRNGVGGASPGTRSPFGTASALGLGVRAHVAWCPLVMAFRSHELPHARDFKNVFCVLLTSACSRPLVRVHAGTARGHHQGWSQSGRKAKAAGPASRPHAGCRRQPFGPLRARSRLVAPPPPPQPDAGSSRHAAAPPASPLTPFMSPVAEK